MESSDNIFNVRIIKWQNDFLGANIVNLMLENDLFTDSVGRHSRSECTPQTIAHLIILPENYSAI